MLGKPIKWILTVFAALALNVSAQEEISEPWELSATGALSAADGNSESLAYSLQLLADYSGELHDARLGFDHFFAEDETKVSTNSFKLHEQWTRKLDELWYVGQYASILNDDVADIDYRMDGSLLLGRHLLNDDHAKFSLEFGPGYAWEDKGGEYDDYMTARLGQRFEYMFNNDVRLWQSFGWTPRVEDPADGVYEAEVGLENRLNGSLSLRTFVRHRVDTEPAAGSGRSDSALMIGLNYAFNSEDEKASVGPDVTSALLGSTLGFDQGWVTTAALGATLNRGNSDKTGAKLDWASDYSDDERELAWELGYHFAEDNGETSTDRLQSRLQGNRYVDERNYLGAAVGYLRDDLADIDYRLTPSILFGRALIKNESTRLAVEAGPMLTLEETGRGADEYLSLRVAQRLKHDFNDRISLKQSVEATTAFEDAQRYTLASKLALDTKLNESLSWRWELESRYENLPVSGRDHHDLLLTSGIAISF